LQLTTVELSPEAPCNARAHARAHGHIGASEPLALQSIFDELGFARELAGANVHDWVERVRLRESDVLRRWLRAAAHVGLFGELGAPARPAPDLVFVRFPTLS
jgi:hypothetical protein